MSILVIDDDPLRIAGFRRAFGQSSIFAAMTRMAIVAKLRSDQPYTRIFLDHDGVDGERLARLMADERLHTQARVYIHSSNYAGAVKMRDILQATHDVTLTSYAEIVGE